eukprot:jgi/Chlat1/8263/Chrsp78S07692
MGKAGNKKAAARKKQPASASSNGYASKKAEEIKAQVFQYQMLVWDSVFDRCCTEPERARQIAACAKSGQERHGRGCVLWSEKVVSAVRGGSGAGFGSSAKQTRITDADDVKVESTSTSVSYLPRACFAPNSQDSELALPPELRAAAGLDAWRMNALMADKPIEEVAEDAYGEAPYDEEVGEFVLLVAIEASVVIVVVNGEKDATVLGADVVWGTTDADGSVSALKVRGLDELLAQSPEEE